MSEEELFALPVAFDLPTAGRAWGFGRTKSYELARADQFPCPVQPFGTRFKVTKVALMKALGYDTPELPLADMREPAA
jgi:hypothetical protein